MSTLLPNAEIIREWDKFTIQNEPVASIDLMERAANRCFDWLLENVKNTENFTIICGIGNNGGDGLAIARLLEAAGKTVSISIIGDVNSASDDFKINLTRLSHLSIVKPIILSSISDFIINKNDCIIDAIYGTGLNRNIDGLAAELIYKINESGNSVISIDMPSGLFADKHTESGFAVVKAAHTLSFQVPKLAFMMPENQFFVGNWHVLDIGLKFDFPNLSEVNRFMISESDIKPLLKRRSKFSHKGTFGHVSLVCGSQGKMGAAIMATDAALRSGAGLVTTHVPKNSLGIIQTALPEAMVSIDSDDDVFTEINELDKYTAIGIGPGLGLSIKTKDAVFKLIERLNIPVVLDADALNTLSTVENGLEKLKPDSILTPHLKEFERIAGKSENDFARHSLQMELSKKHHLYILLKGAHSCLTTPEGTVWFNSTGNPGMAKGGSGDVLCGLIAGLLAQKYSPLHSVLIAMYIHGLSGDLARDEKGEIGMKASDIINNIPNAFKQIE